MEPKAAKEAQIVRHRVVSHIIGLLQASSKLLIPSPLAHGSLTVQHLRPQAPQAAQVLIIRRRIRNGLFLLS